MNKSIVITLLVTALTSPLAHAEMVVIVNPQSSVAALSAEQVANIYLGKDVALAPVDLPEANGARNEFYRKVTGKDAAQVKTIWARLIFTGNAKPPKEVGSPAEAVALVAASPNAIAYVDKSLVNGSVKAVLSIN